MYTKRSQVGAQVWEGISPPIWGEVWGGGTPSKPADDQFEMSDGSGDKLKCS